jgi:hypothetical protein
MLNADSLLGLVGPVLQLPLLVILIRGRHYRRFPFFCLYTGYFIIMSGLQIWAMGHRESFFIVYWGTESISGLLELLALHEAFKPSLLALYETHWWARMLPPFVTLAIGGTALWRALTHPLGHGPLVAFGAGAYAFEVGVRLLEVLIFAVALKLARREHHHIGGLHPFGIVAGFGVAASGALLADLVGLAFAFKFGSGFELVFRYLPSATYAAAALGWLFTFIAKEPPRPQPSSEEIEHRMEDRRRTEEWLKKRGLFRWSNA